MQRAELSSPGTPLKERQSGATPLRAALASATMTVAFPHRAIFVSSVNATRIRICQREASHGAGHHAKVAAAKEDKQYAELIGLMTFAGL